MKKPCGCREYRRREMHAVNASVSSPQRLAFGWVSDSFPLVRGFGATKYSNEVPRQTSDQVAINSGIMPNSMTVGSVSVVPSHWCRANSKNFCHKLRRSFAGLSRIRRAWPLSYVPSRQSRITTNVVKFMRMSTGPTEPTIDMIAHEEISEAPKLARKPCHLPKLR